MVRHFPAGRGVVGFIGLLAVALAIAAAHVLTTPADNPLEWWRL